MKDEALAKLIYVNRNEFPLCNRAFVCLRHGLLKKFAAAFTKLILVKHFIAEAKLQLLN